MRAIFWWSTTLAPLQEIRRNIFPSNLTVSVVSFSQSQMITEHLWND